MKPDISEFSFGYAITDELINVQGTQITAAPVFPSLYKEGQKGGGYDLKLDRPGIPLFLQFKLADCMVRRSADEYERGYLDVPFYRMHLRPRRHSAQHDMLLDLERSGNEVYYCVPAFHKSEELNDAYLNQRVCERSLWIPPTCIGSLPDDGPHHCSFQDDAAQEFYFCSEPQMLDITPNFHSFYENVLSALNQRGVHALHPQELHFLADQITVIGQRKREIPDAHKMIASDEMSHRDSIERIAFYSQIYLDCQFYIIHFSEKD